MLNKEYISSTGPVSIVSLLEGTVLGRTQVFVLTLFFMGISPETSTKVLTLGQGVGIWGGSP